MGLCIKWDYYITLQYVSNVIMHQMGLNVKNLFYAQIFAHSDRSNPMLSLQIESFKTVICYVSNPNCSSNGRLTLLSVQDCISNLNYSPLSC